MLMSRFPNVHPLSLLGVPRFLWFPNMLLQKHPRSLTVNSFDKDGAFYKLGIKGAFIPGMRKPLVHWNVRIAQMNSGHS